jgi:hypothetical protein
LRSAAGVGLAVACRGRHDIQTMLRCDDADVSPPDEFEFSMPRILRRQRQRCSKTASQLIVATICVELHAALFDIDKALAAFIAARRESNSRRDAIEIYLDFESALHVLIERFDSERVKKCQLFRGGASGEVWPACVFARLIKRGSHHASEL